MLSFNTIPSFDVYKIRQLWQFNLFIFTGTVKKCGLLKIVHDKNKSKTETPVIIEPFLGAIEYNKELEALITKNLVIYKNSFFSQNIFIILEVQENTI